MSNATSRARYPPARLGGMTDGIMGVMILLPAARAYGVCLSYGAVALLDDPASGVSALS
jgi:hypothetical protein